MPAVPVKSLQSRAEVALAEGDADSVRSLAGEALAGITPGSPYVAPLKELLAKAAPMSIEKVENR